mmetsp:Transcript_7968/g.32902  ORF Transcript_7968/g.32902 Transcript_7968/m.32902 type:complete len:466 (+) Transcript_7968:290-1687(+)
MLSPLLLALSTAFATRNERPKTVPVVDRNLGGARGRAPRGAHHRGGHVHRSRSRGGPAPKTQLKPPPPRQPSSHRKDNPTNASATPPYACECPDDPKTANVSRQTKNLTAALACAERPIRPWRRAFVDLRCELWCCAAEIARALGLSGDALRRANSRFRQSPFEPILGSRTLATWADASIARRGNEYRVEFDGQKWPLDRSSSRRSALVVAWAYGAGANASAAVEAVAAEATRRNRSRAVLVASGDPPFPTTTPPPSSAVEIEVWATNVGDDDLLSSSAKTTTTTTIPVKPVPLGVSAGPNRLWAATLRDKLLGRRDASLRDREVFFLCSGYRVDDRRRRDLDALRKRGFDECDAPGEHGSRAPPAEYWNRLQSARTVFCPRGFGVATFRAYEALLAGAVPVFEAYAPHAPLFEDLPVLAVPDLHTLTPTHLRARYAALLANRSRLDLRRAFAPFWLAQLARHTT